MIKNLLNADEEPPPGTKVIVEETIVNPPAEPQNTAPLEVEQSAENLETRPIFEIPEDAKFFTNSSETIDETAPLDEDSESEAALMAELEKLEPEDLEFPEREIETAPITETISEPLAEQIATEPIQTERRAENSLETAHGTIFQSEYTPPTTGETIRQSGLAWSAGVVLFASVIFMMILGWLADLLLGSSPWGIVGGVILGGIIGFIQLFRITSQIFKK